jgi:hypothetical protein
MILEHNSGARYNSLPPGLVPRGLTLEQAAAFVSLSPSGFKKRQQMGDYPGPTLPGKRYDLRLLEAAMDRLSNIRKAVAEASQAESTPNPWDTVLIHADKERTS